MLKKILLFILFASLFLSCGAQRNASNMGIKKAQDPDKFVMVGHIIEKDFIKKNGESAGFTELYFRASIQDYFIKFCESSITKKDLTPFVSKVVSIEAEIKNGAWDTCTNDQIEVQSRMGSYLIVKKLL